MSDMEQMFSTLAAMSERQSNNLTELRLQTLHQEHIAKQAENVALIMTVLVRVIAPGMSKDDCERMQNLIKDFQTESLQWRERVSLITESQE